MKPRWSIRMCSGYSISRRLSKYNSFARKYHHSLINNAGRHARAGARSHLPAAKVFFGSKNASIKGAAHSSTLQRSVLCRLNLRVNPHQPIRDGGLTPKSVLGSRCLPPVLFGDPGELRMSECEFKHSPQECISPLVYVKHTPRCQNLFCNFIISNFFCLFNKLAIIQQRGNQYDEY